MKQSGKRLKTIPWNSSRRVVIHVVNDVDKTFRLHWGDKSHEDVKGRDIKDAFQRAGYGGGALSALDYWEELEESDE